MGILSRVPGTETPSTLLLGAAALLAAALASGCSTRCEGLACVPARFDAEPLERKDGAVVLRDAEPHPDAAAVDLDGGLPPDDAGFRPDATTPTSTTTLEVIVGARGRVLYVADAVIPMGGTVPLRPGEVYVEGGRVRCVGARGDCAQMASGATELRGPGVLAPGFVDSHNHIAYDWMPEWRSGRLWNDNGHWRDDPGYEAYVQPYNDNKDDRTSICAMVGWGELRALAHATTTVYGNPQPRTCFQGLARNAELSTGYNGFARDRIRSNALGIDVVDSAAATSLIDAMNAGSVAAYMIHIAEGKTNRSRAELDELAMLGLLRPETVIIHGTALFPEDFVRVAAGGSKLVWSPSSNMALYNGTTDVGAAIEAGIPVALAPDWTLSGTGNMLGELAFARDWLDSHEEGLLSDQDLVEMVTAIPAEHMGIRAEVGRIANGLHADLVWFDVPSDDPFNAIVGAAPPTVRLVVVGGVPTYGDAELLARLPDAPATCHAVDACGRAKRVCGAEPPMGTISPDALSSAITTFFTAGPLALVQCSPR